MRGWLVLCGLPSCEDMRRKRAQLQPLPTHWTWEKLRARLFVLIKLCLHINMTYEQSAVHWCAFEPFVSHV